MSVPDLINGLFEGSAGILLWWNVRRIWKDKKLRGVSLVPTAVFTAWGFWNLWYYPYLNQTLSFLAGILVVFANTTWVSLAVYYKFFYKKNTAIQRWHNKYVLGIINWYFSTDFPNFKKLKARLK